MSKNSPTINFEALQKSKPPKKEEKKKRKIRIKLPKKKTDGKGSRNLRFAKRPIKKWVTFFLYSFLILSFLLLIMTFGRLQTLTSYAYKKEETKQKIAEQINKDNLVTQQVTFEGKQFLKVFFTVEKGEEQLEKRKKVVTAYLANSLPLDSLEVLSSDITRQVREVQLINYLPGEKNTYTLTYDVEFLEKEKLFTAQVQLVASYKESEWKLLNVPTYLNIEKTNEAKKNTDVYNASRFYSKGEEVEKEEQAKITTFVEHFLTLYVKSDENLPLISAVKGLEKANLEQFSIKNIVRKSEKSIVVEGTYTLYYEKGSNFASYFSLTIEKNRETYFVKKMGSN